MIIYKQWFPYVEPTTTCIVSVALSKVIETETVLPAVRVVVPVHVITACEPGESVRVDGDGVTVPAPVIVTMRVAVEKELPPLFFIVMVATPVVVFGCTTADTIAMLEFEMQFILVHVAKQLFSPENVGAGKFVTSSCTSPVKYSNFEGTSVLGRLK